MYLEGCSLLTVIHIEETIQVNVFSIKKFLSTNVQVRAFRGTTNLQAIADLNKSLRFCYSNYSAPLAAFSACPGQLYI
jgi:hypothetical protein